MLTSHSKLTDASLSSTKLMMIISKYEAVNSKSLWYGPYSHHGANTRYVFWFHFSWTGTHFQLGLAILQIKFPTQFQNFANISWFLRYLKN